MNAEIEKLSKQYEGKRFLIRGNHPHAGKVAAFVKFEKTLLGFRPKLRDDSGDEFFVMDKNDWKEVK